MTKYASILICITFAIGGFFSCVPSPSSPSQQDTIDSLLISRFDSLYTFPERMEKEFHKVRESLSDSMAYHKISLFIGYCRYLQGFVDEAIQANDQALRYSQTYDLPSLEAMAWNHRYALLQGINQQDSAIACLHYAYDALYRSDDRRELENVCINLADLYRQKGNLADAARYYRKALWVVDSLKSDRVKFSIYVGLAQVYADLHNFPLAHHYFDLAEQTPDYRLEYEKYYFQTSKGNCYYFEGKYPEALACFKNAYNVVKPFKQPSFDALIEANIGETFMLLGQNDSAHHYLDKSYAYFITDSTANEQVVFYVNSLQAALALHEHKLSAVNHYLSQPYDLSKIGPSYIYLHNKRLMEYYAQQGQYQKAYRYSLLAKKYDDSIRDVRHTNNIIETDYRYSLDTTLLKQNITIANKNIQISKQRYIIVLIAASLVILILIIILTFKHIQRKNDIEYNRQVALVTSLRMENVRNRLSPHYIFNVLNIMMPLFKRYPDLSHLLQLFIQVLRGNLQATEQISVTLEEEIKLVKDFIALHKETHPDNIRTTWNIESGTPMRAQVLSMCIQIPVENALKHAFEGNDATDKRLDIGITHQEGGILINIQDNGNGYDPGKHRQSENGTGNGLKMISNTIRILNAKNTEKMVFDIRNLTNTASEKKRGTLVTLFTPDNYEFKF